MSLEEKSRFTDKETFLLVEGRFWAKLFAEENEKKSEKREDRYEANKMNERKNKYIKKIKNPSWRRNVQHKDARVSEQRKRKILRNVVLMHKVMYCKVCSLQARWKKQERRKERIKCYLNTYRHKLEYQDRVFVLTFNQTIVKKAATDWFKSLS